MDRSIFVGVIVSGTGPEGEPVEHVLTEFSGEGNDAIVFSIAPRDDPSQSKHVMKFFKPMPGFEMTVLHHSFRLAEELYPDHPLLMSPEERMRQLTDEMLGRIESPGSLFRVPAFRDMLQSTVEVMAHHFHESFREGTLSHAFLTEFGPIVSMIDESLAWEIESLLEANGLVEEVRPFFEYCLEAIDTAIEDLKRDGVYRPLAQNRLFKLLGLHLEGFISFEELLDITGSDRFRPSVRVDDVSDLTDVVSILHYRASSKKKGMEEASAEEGSATAREYSELVAAATTASRYLDAAAGDFDPHLPHLVGYARNWHARTLLLDGRRGEAIAMFERALAVLTTEESLTERHDTLIDLARLLWESDPARAQSYAQEGVEIRQRLGIDQS